ncbi:hypothetical protein UMM65_11650 [Aureibaculum sp. 2210JD6-5]|uniref:hypothetical protein n=1 Tax=Aureibaculum sp. 2210JD6-5 TaxID=3103957 RepID=UPI002AAE8B1F|nr:hypothetical protein [Aureibaculum sp. 2210JD6-5]MDY7395901.1 hypothetical protein [Aureibaculum sp. 2210JD6-5]
MSTTPVNKKDKTLVIPPPYNRKFENGIRHPLLYLWDAWSYVEGDMIHLYCLAISRFKPDGTLLQPMERNGFPFHIRHFTSDDSGRNWKDEGCFLKSELWSKKLNCNTVWSGSIEPLADGRKLVAFTGLESVDSSRNFLQNIVLGVTNNGYNIDQVSDIALSSPLRDWKEITKKGYYLDVPEKLGNNKGEDGGPILAWRDPFIFVDKDEKINLFWGGKISPKKSALVRAELKKDQEFYRIEKLFPPVTVPDGNEFTQLELPKVLYDKEEDLYYLVISTCNRLYEGQFDDEVDKGVRLYKSDSIDGPWTILGEKILGSENLFGPTVLKTDFENNRLLCIAPYTDAAEDNLSLTFSPVFYISLDNLNVEFV